MKASSPRELALAGLFAALTAVGAFVRIPIEPVPFTLQPLVVFLAGAVLPARLALGSQLAYLGIGLIGLPVFANGGGPAYVLQPTFGFLVGFALAAWVTALVAGSGRREPGRVRLAAALLVGLGTVYAVGLLGLYLNLAVVQGKASVFSKVALGMGGYLLFDLLKIAVAAAIAPQLRKALA